MNTTEQKRELPAYRVTYEDGTSYVTSMSTETTLAAAREYFVGKPIEQPDGSLKRVAKVTRVEALKLQRVKDMLCCDES